MTAKTTRVSAKAARSKRLTSSLQKLIEDFGRENKDLLAAMQVFEISNAEYERALRALTAAPSITATSTHARETRQDAFVE